MVKQTFVLVGRSTDARDGEDAVRYRDFTTSPKAAEEFAAIPRIQFSDSGHGIVFGYHIHEGGKRGKKTDRLDGYVAEQLAIAKLRKTPAGALAINALEKQINHRQEHRMARQSSNECMAAKYVDDVQLLQRVGETEAIRFGVSREQIRADYLADERIVTEHNNTPNGPFSKWLHFPDGSDAGQVRGSKRWEVWR